MADLPDINTGQVGMIAYFNAIDQGGASSVDPKEVLTAGRVKSYKQYENGVKGKLDSIDHYFQNGNRNQENDWDIDFRVKTDGWFVVHTPRRNDTGKKLWGDSTGGSWSAEWGVIDRVASKQTNATDINTQTKLSLLIDNLVSQLSNSGSITYDQGTDTGYYNYHFGEADTWGFRGAENNSGNDSNQLSVSRTNSVDRKAAYAVAHDQTDNTFDGIQINDVGSDNFSVVGAFDVLAKDAAPDPGVAYDYSIPENHVNHVFFYA